MLTQKVNITTPRKQLKCGSKFTAPVAEVLRQWTYTAQLE